MLVLFRCNCSVILVKAHFCVLGFLLFQEYRPQSGGMRPFQKSTRQVAEDNRLNASRRYFFVSCLCQVPVDTALPESLEGYCAVVDAIVVPAWKSLRVSLCRT